MLRFRWWSLLLLGLPLVAGGCAHVNELGQNDQLPVGWQRKWDEFHCPDGDCW